MNYLKKLRQDAMLTEVEVHSITGYRVETISRWENGLVPSRKATKILAKLYNVNPKSLYKKLR